MFILFDFPTELANKMPEPEAEQDTKSEGKSDGGDLNEDVPQNEQNVTNGDNTSDVTKSPEEENNKEQIPPQSEQMTSDGQSTDNVDTQSTKSESQSKAGTDGRKSSAASSRKEGTKKQRKKADGVHKVTMTVTIAKAIPTGM